MTPSPLPADLRSGILHLGLGAFHRAHQAAFTQDAIAAAGGDWGIEAVSMRNPALAEVLNARGGRYTLIERHPDGPRLQEITVIRRAHALPGNTDAVAARMADPSIHVMTITVTEKGYGAHIGAKRLDRENPCVAQDLANPGAAPQSLVGLLCLGLSKRRAAGLAGLSILSCDNISDNGHLLRALVLELAGETDPDLRDWIARTCTFPCSMVDRITPAAQAETLALANGDPAAIETEPFRQWVIEDAFAGPRPAWEKAGALLVADVRPFEDMKLRLLNGAHSLLAYSGALLGLDMVRDVMADARLAAVIRWHMASAAHSLAPVPGFEIDGYIDDLLARFANPAIAHRCKQIAMDGSQKLPQRLFAPALDFIAKGQSFESCALATAVWLRFVQGTDAQGQPLALDDPLAEGLRRAVADAKGDPSRLVANVGAILGPVAAALWANAAWQAAVTGYLRTLAQDGVAAVLHAAVDTANRP